MARYKLLQPSYVKQHPGAAYPQLLPEGTEIVYDDVPGPHMEPLDKEAEIAMSEYQKARPGATLDPTRHLPNGLDPMAGKTVEQLVMSRLTEIEASASRTSPDAAVLEKLAEGQAQIAQVLSILVTALNGPTPQKKAS